MQQGFDNSLTSRLTNKVKTSFEKLFSNNNVKMETTDKIRLHSHNY